MPSFVTELSLDGKVLNRTTLPPLETPHYETKWTQYLWSLPTPILSWAWDLAWIKAHDWLEMKESSQEWQDTQEDESYVLKSGLVSAFSGLMCSLFARRLSRRDVFTSFQRKGWMMVVFLLGPMGLLMFIAVQEWPRQETCTGCGRKRVVTRERCEHCNTEFPLPARDGTEIFEISA